MPLRSRKSPPYFDVPVHDMMLRITGPPELYEEARAAGMQFWGQLQSHPIPNPMFQSSKRPIYVPQDAPPKGQRMGQPSLPGGGRPSVTHSRPLTRIYRRVAGRGG